MKSDIEIAQEAELWPITEVASDLGVSGDDIELYGKYKCKLSDEYISSLKDKKDGKLILVTAINPTPAGEGKTTTTVGLGQAMKQLPHDDEVPSIRSPRLFVLRVSADVAAELGVPERAIGLRTRCSRTDRCLDEPASIPFPAMLVPEASAHLDERAALGDHNVRMAHDSPVADAEAVSVRPEHLPNADLRQRVARMYRRHHLRPHLRSYRVHSFQIPLSRRAFA